MFRVPYLAILEMVFKKAIIDCNGNTKCVSTLVNLKENYGHHILLIMSKGTFGLRASSRS